MNGIIVIKTFSDAESGEFFSVEKLGVGMAVGVGVGLIKSSTFAREFEVHFKSDGGGGGPLAVHPSFPSTVTHERSGLYLPCSTCA